MSATATRGGHDKSGFSFWNAADALRSSDEGILDLL
jgi:hypothetical protein